MQGGFMRFFTCILAVTIICWSNNQLFSNTMKSEYEKASQYLEERGEVCFNFYVNSSAEIDKLTWVISIDKVEGNKVFAYANKEGFNEFLTYNLYYEVAVPPGLLTTAECSDYSDQDIPYDWTQYPTMSAYLEMMDNFESTYPDICKKYEYGTSVNGEKLLAARISDNVAIREREPEFLATSTIHGDETLGFVLMLRMIEYLCMNYQSDQTVTTIVDNIDMWICPLTNPDGTYRGSNTITSPRRYNENGRDLNRNFEGPSAKYGLYNSYEKEVKAIIDLEDAHNYTVGIDIHGGMESCVYPWAYATKRPIDEVWWKYVCGNYAETAWANSPSGYLKTKTNGYGCAGPEFYTAPGTRMDGPYYHSHLRDITLELHSQKFLNESELDDHWTYNRDAILGLFLETLNGVQGLVTDSITDEPINDVKVFIDNFDEDSTFTRSDTNGTYARPIMAGTYDFIFSHPGYQSKTIDNVQVTNGQPTVLNVKLWDGSTSVDIPYLAKQPVISIAPFNKGFRITYKNSSENAMVSIYTIKGKLIRTLTNESINKQSLIWDGKDYKGQFISNGYYIIKFKNKQGTAATGFIVNR